jgi:hypothetical protein
MPGGLLLSICMEKKKVELTDLAVNELGQLVEVPGLSRYVEYGEFGLPVPIMKENPINKISDCPYRQEWSEENYFQESEEDNNENSIVAYVCFGYNAEYVDPYKGW